MQTLPDYSTTADPWCTCFAHLQGEELNWWCPKHGIQWRWTKEEPDHEPPTTPTP